MKFQFQVSFGVDDVKPQTVWGLDLSVIFPYCHCVSLELAREKYVLSYIAGALGHWGSSSAPVELRFGNFQH